MSSSLSKNKKNKIFESHNVFVLCVWSISTQVQHTQLYQSLLLLPNGATFHVWVTCFFILKIKNLKILISELSVIYNIIIIF